MTQNFDYDSLNRLLTATEPVEGSLAAVAWRQSQGYDQYGNRWIASNPGLPAVTTSVPNTPGAFPGDNGNNNRLFLSGVSYDSAGNVSTYNSAALYYDGENRLVPAVNASTFNYSYDGEGRRVQRTDNNGTVTLVYDAQGQLAAEYGPAADYPDTGRQFLTADHLGSTRLVTDAAGNDVARYDYLPFELGKQGQTGRNVTNPPARSLFPGRQIAKAARFPAPAVHRLAARKAAFSRNVSMVFNSTVCCGEGSATRPAPGCAGLCGWAS